MKSPKTDKKPIRPDRSRSPARGAPTEEKGPNGPPNPRHVISKTDKNRYWGLLPALMMRFEEDSFARPREARHGCAARHSPSCSRGHGGRDCESTGRVLDADRMLTKC